MYATDFKYIEDLYNNTVTVTVAPDFIQCENNCGKSFRTIKGFSIHFTKIHVRRGEKDK